MLYLIVAATLFGGLAAFFCIRTRALSTELAAAYAENSRLRQALAGDGGKKTTEIYPGRYPYLSPPSPRSVSPSPLVRLQYVNAEVVAPTRP